MSPREFLAAGSRVAIKHMRSTRNANVNTVHHTQFSRRKALCTCPLGVLCKTLQAKISALANCKYFIYIYFIYTYILYTYMMT